MLGGGVFFYFLARCIIQDAMVHCAIAVGLLPGAVAISSFVPQWREAADTNPVFENSLNAVVRSSVALAVSSCYWW